MSDSVYLYPLPLDAARKNGEIAKWRGSFWENVRCKQAVEAAIRESFDGMNLDTSCVASTVDKYGYNRLRYVLSNTVQELWHDGRFSVTNKEWSKQVYIPPDREHNYQFCVSSHPAVLDGFISEFRKLDMSFAGRIGKEYADYEAEMLTHPASYVFSHADEISAMQSCYVYLTNCLSYQQDTEQPAAYAYG